MKRNEKMNIKRIMRKYPLKDKRMKMPEKYIKSVDYTVTFDIFLAYKLRENNIKVILWGARYHGKTAYVFEKKDIAPNELPF